MITTIAKHESRRWKRSPLIWLTAGISLFLLAYLFLTFTENFANVIQIKNTGAQIQTGATDAIIAPTLMWAGMIGLGLLPLLSMRFFAEERQLKTWPLLASSPLTPLQLVAGKFFSILLLISIFCALSLLMPLSLSITNTIDIGKMLSSSLGMFLLLASFASATLYCSSLVKSSMAAILLSAGLLAILTLIYTSAGASSNADGSLYPLAHFGHFSSFLQGKLTLADIGYYLIFTAFFFWLTVRRIAVEKISKRMPHRLITTIGAFILLAAGILLIQQNAIKDVSSFDSNSLTPAEIQILNTLDGPITIRGHIENKPQIRLRVTRALAPYLKVKPDIHIQWEDIDTPTEDQQPSRSAHLVFNYKDQTAVITRLDRDKLTQVFYQLSHGKQRWIGFLQEHGEKDLNSRVENGYSDFKSLLNTQGYNTLALTADSQIPDNLDLLIIASPTQQYPSKTQAFVENWLNAGKALFWMQDKKPSEKPLFLASQTSIEFLPGFIISANTALQTALNLKHPAVIPVATGNHQTAHLITKNLRGVSLFPIARAISPLGLPPWKSTPLIQTSAASWNETSVLTGHLERDNKQEQQGPLTIMVAQTRAFGAQEQRVIISGDSDFLSNDYLGYGNNRQLTLRAIGWLVGDKVLLDLFNEPLPDASLALSPSALIGIAVLFLLLIPGGFLLTGAWLWYGRRHA